MAKPVDGDAVRDSEKALTVIFILAILAANAVLVVKLLRRAGSRLLQLPQLYVLIALAFGDILVALFMLVIRARTAYEDNLDLPCSSRIMYYVYPYFNGFVFCAGLIVLVMETLLPQSLSMNVLVMASVVSGGLPYLVGLLIVLPLILAGFNWNTCDYDNAGDSILDRMRAVSALSYLVLPLLALIANVILPIYKRRVSENDDAQMLDPPSSQENYLDGTLQIAMRRFKKNSLAIVSIVTVIFYAPLAIFQLAYIFNQDRSTLDPIPETAINLFLFWFSCLRPVITPLLLAFTFIIPDLA